MKSFSPIALAAAIIGIFFFLVPVIGLGTRLEWSEIGSLIRDPIIIDALRISFITSLIAVALAMIFGIPIASLLARPAFPGQRFLRTAITLPMVLPPVVAGVGLLSAFGRRGVFGAYLERVGISLPFTTAAVVLAQAFVASPFLILQVEAGLRGLDRRYESLAATFGASRFLIFRRITIPRLAPALVSGIAVAWARALGEFGATITFAGNLEGVTQTMPIAVYMAMEQNPDAGYLIAVLLLGISFFILFLLRGNFSFERGR